MTLDGAMVGWTIHNRPNDPTTFDLWRKRFEEIKAGQRIASEAVA